MRLKQSFFPLTTLWLCATVSWLTSSAVLGKTGPDHQPLSSVILAGDTTSTEITHTEPTHYAVIFHETGSYRTLHRAEDVLFHPQDPTRSFVIVAVTGQSVTLRETRTGRTWVWLPKSPFPGLPTLTLVETVLLEQVEFQLKVVPAITHPDPILLAITGARALVEKEILPKDLKTPSNTPNHPNDPSSARWSVTNPALARLTHVTQVDKHTYELDSGSIKPALENLGQLLSDLEVMVSPTLSVQAGMGVQVASEAADGVLDQGGFTVTNSKLAQWFGIESGDTIVRINQQPVTSPANAWWAYQEFIIRNSGRTDLRVDLIRDGTVMTKTYRFR